MLLSAAPLKLPTTSARASHPKPALCKSTVQHTRLAHSRPFTTSRRPLHSRQRYRRAVRVHAGPATAAPQQVSHGVKGAVEHVYAWLSIPFNSLVHKIQEPVRDPIQRVLLVSLLSLVAADCVARCVRWMAAWVQKRFDACIKMKTTPSTLLSFTKILVCSLAPPLSVYLPFAAILGALNMLQGSMLGTFTARLQQRGFAEGSLPAAINAAISTSDWKEGAVDMVLWELQRVLGRTTASHEQLLQVAVIVFGVWFVLRAKQELVDVVVVHSKPVADTKKGNNTNFSQMILPLSGLVSWLVTVAGMFMALGVLGFNVQPLLAVGGVGGIVVGWSAQSVCANMLQGLSLFVSQPFVVGERISLRDTGGTVVRGYVESISPMYTSIRSDELTLVKVPNKLVGEMVVRNESRIAITMIESQYNEPRQLRLTLNVEGKDVYKIGSIVGQISTYLSNDPAVYKDLPYGCNVSSVDGHVVKLTLVAHTTPEYSSKFDMFATRVSIDLMDILNQHRNGSVTAGSGIQILQGAGTPTNHT